MLHNNVFTIARSVVLKRRNRTSLELLGNVFIYSAAELRKEGMLALYMDLQKMFEIQILLSYLDSTQNAFK